MINQFVFLIFAIFTGDEYKLEVDVMEESLKKVGNYTGQIWIKNSGRKNPMAEGPVIYRPQELSQYKAWLHVETDCLFRKPVQPLIDQIQSGIYYCHAATTRMIHPFVSGLLNKEELEWARITDQLAVNDGVIAGCGDVSEEFFGVWKDLTLKRIRDCPTDIGASQTVLNKMVASQKGSGMFHCLPSDAVNFPGNGFGHTVNTYISHFAGLGGPNRVKLMKKTLQELTIR